MLAHAVSGSLWWRARDLGQTLGGLRFCRLTTPFRPVNPPLGGHGAFLVTKKCAVCNPRSLIFTNSLAEEPEENSGFHQSKIAGARQRVAQTIIGVLLPSP